MTATIITAAEIRTDSPHKGWVRLGVTDDAGNRYELMFDTSTAAQAGTELSGLAQISEDDDL